MCGLKAFRVSDDEIYAGSNEAEAIRSYSEDTGERVHPGDVLMVTDDELDSEIPEFDENECPTGRMTTLRVYLNEMTEPGFLAGRV